MSKMSKIDQIHLRAVMLCMSKTLKILKQAITDFLEFICTVMLCADRLIGVFDLSSTSSTLLLSFVQYSMHSMLCIFDIFDIHSIALQPLGVFDLSSTSLTYIALQPLGVFDLSSTSSTLL